MVKVCRTPELARHYFSPNDLSGWVEGVKFTAKNPTKKKPKPKNSRKTITLIEDIELEAPPVEAIETIITPLNQVQI